MRLQHRTKRKLALTDAGERYLLRVRGILHEIEDAQAVLGCNSQEITGNLHVLATPLLANNFLAPQIINWLKRYPKVMLDLTIDPCPQSRIDELDVTFMGVDEGYDSALVARPWGCLTGSSATATVEGRCGVVKFVGCPALCQCPIGTSLASLFKRAPHGLRSSSVSQVDTLILVMPAHGSCRSGTD